MHGLNYVLPALKKTQRTPVVDIAIQKLLAPISYGCRILDLDASIARSLPRWLAIFSEARFTCIFLSATASSSAIATMARALQTRTDQHGHS